MAKTNYPLRSMPWRVVGATCLMLAMTAWMFPVSLIPFVNTLPYLQVEPVAVRIIWSGLFYLAAIAGARLAMTSQQWHAIKSLTLNSWKDQLVLLLSVVMAVFAAAEYSGNTFGSLVKLIPGETYSKVFVVKSVKPYGSRSKAAELELRSATEDKTYTVTFSRRLFTYDKFHAGDEILLNGKQNLFGVYIDGFKLRKAP